MLEEKKKIVIDRYKNRLTYAMVEIDVYGLVLSTYHILKYACESINSCETTNKI